MPVEFEAAARLLALIEKARANPMLRVMPGARDIVEVLDQVGVYIEGQELRWTAVNANLQGLAKIMLKKHYGVASLTAAELAGLQRLVDNELTVEPGDVLERARDTIIG